jgi:hypothetical protein
VAVARNALAVLPRGRPGPARGPGHAREQRADRGFRRWPYPDPQLHRLRMRRGLGAYRYESNVTVVAGSWERSPAIPWHALACEAHSGRNLT